MAQKVVKKVGRPSAKKAPVPAEKKMIQKPTIENQFPEVEKIETIEVEKPKQPEKIRPVRRRRNLHPVEINGTVRMLTKLAYNSIRRNPNMEIILPKDSPFNESDDCVGC